MTSLLDAKSDLVIKSLFAYYDKDNDDKLQFDEFRNLCDDLGFRLHDFQFNYINVKENNKMSYDEFKNWWIDEDKFKLMKEENMDNMFCAYEIYLECLQEYKTLNHENFNKMTKKYYGIETTKDEYMRYNRSGNNRMNFKEFMDWLDWI